MMDRRDVVHLDSIMVKEHWWFHDWLFEIRLPNRNGLRLEVDAVTGSIL
jgi:hypothetical protein